MSLPYFNLYPRDFEADTSHLALEEDGAYNRLLRLCWMTPGCSLPDDDAWIMRRIRVDADTYARIVAPLISEFFIRKSGRVSNARLTREFDISNAAHERRVSAGKSGGKAKALKTNKTEPSNATAMPKQPEPEPDIDSEANASDASVDFAKTLFDRGVSFLKRNGTKEPQARSVIGKWRKAYQDTDIFDAFAACSKQGATDPIPWITARLQANGKENNHGKPANRSETRLRAFIAGAGIPAGMDSWPDRNPSVPLLARG